MQDRFAGLGARMIGDAPEEFAARIAAERKHLGEIIRAAGLKPQ